MQSIFNFIMNLTQPNSNIDIGHHQQWPLSGSVAGSRSSVEALTYSISQPLAGS
jgi:hypothetical protein